MYTDLINFFRTEGYFLEVQLKDLQNSFCQNSTIRLLNFTAIKERFYGMVNRPMPRSVNGAIFTSVNKLFLVQTEPYYSAYADWSIEYVLTTYFNDKCMEKVTGSIQVLSDMLAHYNISGSFSSFFATAPSERVQTIIVTELTDEQYLAMKIGFMDEWNIGENDPVMGEITLMNCEDFEQNFA